MKKPLKKIPTFASEDEEREFWATADSTEYIDWSEARQAAFPKLNPTDPTNNDPSHPEKTP